MINIRPTVRQDLDEVFAIERRQFQFPWTPRNFHDQLRRRDVLSFVAEDAEDTVVGYAVYRIEPKEIAILNLAVHYEKTFQGIGRKMVERLKGKLHSDRRTRINAMVCENNLAAQLFFKKLGFKWAATERSPFEDTDYDGYVMEHILEQEAPHEAMECSNS